MDVIQRLYDLMNQHDLTANKLALASGLSPSTVSSIFSTKSTPTIETIEAICKGLGISLYDFFYNENPQASEIDKKYNILTSESKEIIDFLLNKLK